MRSASRRWRRLKTLDRTFTLPPNDWFPAASRFPSNPPSATIWRIRIPKSTEASRALTFFAE